MLQQLFKVVSPCLPIVSRGLSVSATNREQHKCTFLVVGGGSAGCSMAAKLARDFPKESLIVLEPSQLHYYQPLFTLVGAGADSLAACSRKTAQLLPSHAKLLVDSAAEFQPQDNQVVTQKGDRITYENMVVATGLQLNFRQTPGLSEALSQADSGVCSIYSPQYVEQTWGCMQRLAQGEAVFTFPPTPVKCPGAPQKIMYLTEDYLRKKGLRDAVKVSYYSSLGVIFGVKKYADALWKVVEKRDMKVNLRHSLQEVRGGSKEAVFQNMDKPEETTTVKYSMLHVTPCMGAVPSLQTCSSLSNSAGLVRVDPHTLQHTTHPNVFALGDCTDTPNSKTAAAVAAQSGVLQKNIRSFRAGKPLSAHYDGYASCPLVTSLRSCILAEFDYKLQPLETFPMDQARERLDMYLMKAHAMPRLYWSLMTKGMWNGPGMLRKIFHPLQ